MKECIKCNKLKPDKDFRVRSDSGNMRGECKKCATSFNVDYGQIANRNKQDYLDKRCDSRCFICKEKFPAAILAFHHIDPSTKEFSLNRNKWSGKYKVRDKTLAEADKCAVLCHNCHAFEHEALKEGYSLLEKDCNQMELDV